MGQFLSFSELWRAFKRQLPLMLLVLLIGIPAAYFYAVTRPKVYEAVALVAIEGPPTTEIQTDPGLTSRLSEIQQAVLSRENLSRYVQQFDLFPGAPSEALRVDLTREAISINPFGEDLFRGGRPTGLSIAVRLEDPQKAADFANVLNDAILAEDRRRAQLRLEAAIDRATEAHTYLSGEQDRVGREISALERQIADFRKENAGSLPENILTQRARSEELEASRIQLERELAYYAQANESFRTEVTERHRAGLQAELQAVLEEIDQIAQALQIAPEVERQAAEFDRGLQTLEAELAALTTTRTQVAIDQQLRGQESYRLALSDTALPPEAPVSRSRRMIAMASGMVVVALALGVGVLRELMQSSIRTAAQMKRQLDIEPVVVIPLIYPQKPPRRLSQVGIFIGTMLVAIFAGSAALVWQPPPLDSIWAGQDEVPDQ